MAEVEVFSNGENVARRGRASQKNTAHGGDAKKAWKDIWVSGQGIGAVKSVLPAAELVARLSR